MHIKTISKELSLSCGGGIDMLTLRISGKGSLQPKIQNYCEVFGQFCIARYPSHLKWQGWLVSCKPLCKDAGTQAYRLLVQTNAQESLWRLSFLIKIIGQANYIKLNAGPVNVMRSMSLQLLVFTACCVYERPLQHALKICCSIKRDICLK